MYQVRSLHYPQSDSPAQSNWYSPKACLNFTSFITAASQSSDRLTHPTHLLSAFTRKLFTEFFIITKSVDFSKEKSRYPLTPFLFFLSSIYTDWIMLKTKAFWRATWFFPITHQLTILNIEVLRCTILPSNWAIVGLYTYTLVSQLLQLFKGLLEESKYHSVNTADVIAILLTSKK